MGIHLMHNIKSSMNCLMSLQWDLCHMVKNTLPALLFKQHHLYDNPGPWQIDHFDEWVERKEPFCNSTEAV